MVSSAAEAADESDRIGRHRQLGSSRLDLRKRGVGAGAGVVVGGGAGGELRRPVSPEARPAWRRLRRDRRRSRRSRARGNRIKPAHRLRDARRRRQQHRPQPAERRRRSHHPRSRFASLLSLSLRRRTLGSSRRIWRSVVRRARAPASGRLDASLVRPG